jgi:hypothetical protein
MVIKVIGSASSDLEVSWCSDRVLGYNKYSVRRDGGEKAYNDIAQKV